MLRNIAGTNANYASFTRAVQLDSSIFNQSVKIHNINVVPFAKQKHLASRKVRRRNYPPSKHLTNTYFLCPLSRASFIFSLISDACHISFPFSSAFFLLFFNWEVKYLGREELVKWKFDSIK